MLVELANSAKNPFKQHLEALSNGFSAFFKAYTKNPSLDSCDKDVLSKYHRVVVRLSFETTAFTTHPGAAQPQGQRGVDPGAQTFFCINSISKRAHLKKKLKIRVHKF